MRIKITISGVTFKDGCPPEEKKFELESDSFYNFNEVAKCIIESGYIIKAYRFFDGT